MSRRSAALVLSRDHAIRFAENERLAGRRVVFTNGVFDLLHRGHVEYLNQARAEGDVLIVGLNADRSVRRLKGPDRPILPAGERAEILAALSPVDAVVVFDEDTPAELIAALAPDVLVKGADWPADGIVGREVVEARGGIVVRVALTPGRSTTGVIDRVLRGRPDLSGRS